MGNLVIFRNVQVLKSKKEYHNAQAEIQSDTIINKSFLQYVRYGSDFIVGVGGSKELSISIRDQIDNFLNTHLYLEIQKNQLINRNNGAVLFLGFLIYLAKIRRKVEIKEKKIANITKYRKRIIARLSRADARLAKAAIY